MTTVVANLPFSNFQTTADYGLLLSQSDYTTVEATGTRHTISSATAALVWEAAGSDLTYLELDGEQVLALGTVASIVVQKSSVVAYTMTGSIEWLGLPVFDLTGGTFFSGNDNITGSDVGFLDPLIDDTNDIIFGCDGDDTISARGGKDSVFGGQGADTIDGGEGDDTLFGEAGGDVLKGGGGDDELVVIGNDGAGDTFDGGAGIDTLLIALSSIGSGVLTNFDALASSIEILTGNGKTILGTSGSNTIDLSGLTAISGVPAVDGGPGNDILVGTSLATVVLFGGDGDDTLSGSAAVDTFNGGGGSDRFLFDDAISKTNVDHLVDFAPGVDQFVLDKTIFKGLKAGELKAKLLLAKKNADAAKDKDDRLIYDTKTGEFRFDPDGKGGTKAKIIGILDGSPDKLGASDIVVVA